LKRQLFEKLRALTVETLTVEALTGEELTFQKAESVNYEKQ
jgi:hypothetical protein